MKWLLLYFDPLLKKYIYRIFTDSDNCLSYRDKLLNHGVRTCYCYRLYGKYGGFYEKTVR